MLINDLIGGASNVKTGANPPFQIEDFIEVYPQFGENEEGIWNVPLVVIEMHLDRANACIKKSRWHKQWKMGMCLYIAHYCTLYLQGIMDANNSVQSIAQAGTAQGIDTSISVDGVSISTDYSVMNTSTDTWTGWGSTIYGQQLMALAKLMGKGGMFTH